ncbi:MAG: hypothetical protein HC796_04600 [Synechococcaceae cyanobacterium RL_1_2]|nr:hypothetical protein [Synechococcaceae cyanobacterium RL_1_2]
MAKLGLIGKKIDFAGVTTNFDQLGGVLGGYIDLQNGFALSAEVEPAKVTAVLKAFNLPKLSFPLTGELAARVNLMGR